MFYRSISSLLIFTDAFLQKLGKKIQLRQNILAAEWSRNPAAISNDTNNRKIKSNSTETVAGTPAAGERRQPGPVYVKYVVRFPKFYSEGSMCRAVLFG
jgi:hypothetical protein